MPHRRTPRGERASATTPYLERLPPKDAVPADDGRRRSAFELADGPIAWMTAEPQAAVGLNGRYGLVPGDLLVGRDSRQWVVADFDEFGRVVATAEVV